MDGSIPTFVFLLIASLTQLRGHRSSDGGQTCLLEAISSLCFILWKVMLPDSPFPVFVAFPSARIRQLLLLEYLLTEELPKGHEAQINFSQAI